MRLSNEGLGHRANPLKAFGDGGPLILFYFFNLTPQIVKAGSTPAWSGIS
jgi:hypothetical protein